MKASDLNYIADTLVLEAFLSQGDLIKTAGMMDSIGQGVVDQIKSIYDPNKPALSIANFIARGALFRFLPGNLKILGLLCPLAEALGFDWKSFWSSLAQNVYNFIKGTKSGNQKGSPQQIDNFVKKTFEESDTGQTDETRLKELAKSNPSLASRKEDAIIVRGYTKVSSFKKEAFSKSRLLGFFMTLVSWILKTSFVSLGIIAGVGAISGLLGLNKSKKEQAQGQNPDGSARTVSSDETPAPSQNQNLASRLKISPDVSQELYSEHRNDNSNIWIEKGDINDLNNIVMSWILNAYPQMQKVQRNIASSSSFRSIIDSFNKRNKYANGLNIFAVPKQYSRKIDIVNSIMNGFLQQYAENQEQKQDKDQDTQVNYK